MYALMANKMCKLLLNEDCDHPLISLDLDI